MFLASIIVALGSLFSEISNALIKKDKELGLFHKILILILFQILFSIIGILIFGGFEIKTTNYFLIFGLTLLNSLVLILFYVFAIKAIEKSDRSTYSFFMVLILPMLLISDIILGYKIDIYQIIGVLFIFVSLLFISYTKSINFKGIKYVIITLFIVFAGINTYKFIITHYVDAFTQLLFNGILTSIIVFSILVYKERSLSFIKEIFHIKYLGIGFFSGLSNIFASLAYLFGPASIITALSRVFSILFSILIGKYMFCEKNFSRKIKQWLFISFGIFIMNLQILLSNISWIINIETSILDTNINKKELSIRNTQFSNYSSVNDYIYLINILR